MPWGVDPSRQWLGIARYYLFSVSRPALPLGTGEVGTLSSYSQVSCPEKLLGMKFALGISSDGLENVALDR